MGDITRTPVLTNSKVTKKNRISFKASPKFTRFNYVGDHDLRSPGIMDEQDNLWVIDGSWDIKQKNTPFYHGTEYFKDEKYKYAGDVI